MQAAVMRTVIASRRTTVLLRRSFRTTTTTTTTIPTTTTATTTTLILGGGVSGGGSGDVRWSSPWKQNGRPTNNYYGRHRHGRCYHATTSVPSNNKKKALVIGSSGALGSYIARDLSLTNGMDVMGADVLPEIPQELSLDNWQLDDFCDLSSSSSNNLEDMTIRLAKSVSHFANNQLHVIVVASGGWQGDDTWLVQQPVSTKNDSDNDDEALLLRQQQAGAGSSSLGTAKAYAKNMTDMLHQNLFPVLATGYLAHYCMHPRENPLIVVMGATAALQPTPGMLAYGTMKCATHHIIQTIGCCTPQLSLENKKLRQQGRKHITRHSSPSLDHLHIIGILPTVLDTPNNRKYMKYNESWTKPKDISLEIGKWIEEPLLRPHSGALVKVHNNKHTHHDDDNDDDSDSNAVFELVR